ncbi:MAG: flagellar export chaperone FliS [FCB group bacterium]|nr:flagellar export chaperone FliS [FCB group bacterium]
MKRAQNVYQEEKIMNMSQVELILHVYQGSIGFMKSAKADFQEDRLVEGRAACEKARKCIVHLYTTLDMEKGQEIANYLSQLYAYIIQQLDLITASKSIEQIDDVINVLQTLKDGWENIKEQQGNDTVASSRPMAAVADADGEAEAAPVGAGGLTISA